GEVEQRAAEAVHLVDQHAIHLPLGDVGQKVSEGRPVHVGAGKPAVVVVAPQALPAFLLLALDVGLGGGTLGVQGVEVLLQPLLAGLAGVDGTADRALVRQALSFVHGCSPFCARRKNKKPLQWQPVTALATADREGYLVPSNSKPWVRTRTCRVRPL